MKPCRIQYTIRDKAARISLSRARAVSCIIWARLQLWEMKQGPKERIINPSEVKPNTEEQKADEEINAFLQFDSRKCRRVLQLRKPPYGAEREGNTTGCSKEKQKERRSCILGFKMNRIKYQPWFITNLCANEGATLGLIDSSSVWNCSRSLSTRRILAVHHQV